MSTTAIKIPTVERWRVPGDNRDEVATVIDKDTGADYPFTGHTAALKFRESVNGTTVVLDASSYITLATGKITIGFSSIDTAVLALAMPVGRYVGDLTMATTGGPQLWARLIYNIVQNASRA